MREKVIEHLSRVAPEMLADCMFDKEVDSESGSLHEYAIGRLGAALGCSETHMGITKFVLAWDDLPDVVVKIPFIGRDVYVMSGDGDNDGYEYVETKAFDENYCDIDCEIVKEANSIGLGYMFADVEYLTTLYEYIPVYVAERCSAVDADENQRSCSALFKRLYALSVPDSIIRDTIGQRGEHAIRRLTCFLEESGIDDLHDENWGLSKNGYLKIIDASSWHEDFD